MTTPDLERVREECWEAAESVRLYEDITFVGPHGMQQSTVPREPSAIMDDLVEALLHQRAEGAKMVKWHPDHQKFFRLRDALAATLEGGG